MKILKKFLLLCKIFVFKEKKEGSDRNLQSLLWVDVSLRALQACTRA